MGYWKVPGRLRECWLLGREFSEEASGNRLSLQHSLYLLWKCLHSSAQNVIFSEKPDLTPMCVECTGKHPVLFLSATFHVCNM